MQGTVKILIVINCTLLAMYNAAVILLRTHERMDKAILGVGLHCDGDSIGNHCDVLFTKSFRNFFAANLDNEFTTSWDKKICHFLTLDNIFHDACLTYMVDSWNLLQ